MSRLRYNGVATAALPLSLGAALTSGGTTITFNAALKYGGGTAVPTLAAGEYLPLTIIDPLTLAASEVVWLTAYTAGATTGTISRGQEGTSGVAHASGDRVVHGALIADVAGHQLNPISGKGGIPGVIHGAIASGFAITTGITRFFAFSVMRPTTITAMKINVTSAGTAGGTIRAGLYQADSVWQPTTLVRDHGEVASDSTGLKSFAVGPDTIAAGRYLLAVRQSSVALNPGVRTVQYQCPQFATYDLANSTYTNTLTKSEAYGAFASTGVPWDTIGVGSTAGFVCPLVMEWTD